MLTLSLSERVQKFKTSSAFTSGDPFSFSVVLNKNLRLPGKFDPETYIQNLGQSIKGKSVCIVCPGNGGLCVEALRAGAERVAAVEPRPVYQRSLKTVAEFAHEVFGSSFDIVGSLGKPWSFDVIIWSEGLDELRDPRSIIADVIASIAPGGVLFFELSHGTAGLIPDQTNSWKPTRDGFLATIAGFEGVEISGELPGRNQTRTAYKIQSLLLPTKARAEESKVATLTPPQSDSQEDVEYFRRLLFEAVGVMKSGAVETPKISAATDAGPTEGSKPEPKAENKPELSEVYEREAEVATARASTPKSRRKGAKDSKF